MKWKPGDMIKTTMPKHGTDLFDETRTVVVGIILESTRHYTFDLEKKEIYYKILIQNAPPVTRYHAAVYPIDTPDEYIIEKENELPF